MSRSGYTDDCEYLFLYRHAVERALKGRRGQAFLRELAAAMDAMPKKRLITGELIDETGEVCALGAVAKVRGLDVASIEIDDPSSVAEAFGIARSMAAEIAWMNDEAAEWSNRNETDEQRWQRIRKWIAEQIIEV